MRRFLCWLGRRLPLISGYGRLASSSLCQSLARLDEEIVETTLRNGSRILVPIGDHIGRAIYFFGEHDGKVSKLIEMILNPGDVFVDIGANLGTTVLTAATSVGPNGKVYAFEPNPVLFDWLQQSIGLNELNNVEAFNVALGKENVTQTMNLRGSNLGTGSLKYEYEGSEERVQMEVEVVNADEFFAKGNIGKAKLLKIDVEGMEAEVFCAAKGYMQSSPPEMILFEMHPDNRSFYEQELVMILAEMGYNFLDIKISLFRLRLAHLDQNSGGWEGHDIIAYREPRSISVLKRYLS